jgi:hypothetical protein
MSGNEGKSGPPEKNILVTEGNDRDPYGKGGGQSGSGNGSGWNIGIGSGGGSGFFSGGFGGSSRKKAKKRAKARKRALAQQRAEAEAQARGQAEAQAQAQREAAHRQLIETLSQTYTLKKDELDRKYALKSSALNQLIESEKQGAKRAPKSSGSEPWTLYLISKERAEINGLIAKKKSEFQEKTVLAHAFNGRDPLTQSAQDYQNDLSHSTANDPASAHNTHNNWESAYTAAHEARILSESIRVLSEASQALSVRYTEQEIRWREIERVREGQRRYEVQREEQIKFKRRVDEESRRDLIKAANTTRLSSPAIAGGAMVWGRSGIAVAEGAAVALEGAITSAAKELARIAAIRLGQTVSVGVSALFYSPELGNGELTSEQRRRLFQGVAVRPQALGMPTNTDLNTIADVGGSVELPSRIKAIPSERGTELHLVSTGGSVSAGVPVFQASFDPLSNAYQAQTSGPQPKYLEFDSSTAAPKATGLGSPELHATEPQAVDVPLGVDTRISDCVVCFPADSGLQPQYFSFANEIQRAGVVTGNGQAASADWWKSATQGTGAFIPAQFGELYQHKEFASIGAFDRALWRTIAEDSVLGRSLDEFNRKRMARGFAPYAPKATWDGDRREFEIRVSNAANDGAAFFKLDQLSITLPNSPNGLLRVTPTFLPWPVSGANQTWTPLVPPGSESLGPTELPAAPEQPAIYPGETIDPVDSQNESLPSVDPDDVNASIPGYGEDDDLPSPDLVFAGPPVDPLEVGPYNELSGRSRLDGLDIDHIVSRQALKRHILRADPYVSEFRLRALLNKGPSIAIPSEVHRKFSETYAGRNTKEKQEEDSKDLRAAVDSNFSAIKIGLIELGYDEVELEASREKLHELKKQQGWYE